MLERRAEISDVAVRNGVGVRFVTPVPPNRWQGEADCLVGPFSCRQVAEYFQTAVIEFNHYSSAVPTIFARGDSWYISMSQP